MDGEPVSLGGKFVVQHLCLENERTVWSIFDARCLVLVLEVYGIELHSHRSKHCTPSPPQKIEAA